MTKIIKDLQQLIKENIWNFKCKKLYYQLECIKQDHKIINKYKIQSCDINKLYIIAAHVNNLTMIDNIIIHNNTLEFHHHEYLNN
jgi:hypothetical protein